MCFASLPLLLLGLPVYDQDAQALRTLEYSK